MTDCPQCFVVRTKRTPRTNGSPSIAARPRPLKNTGNCKGGEKFVPGLTPRLRLLSLASKRTSGWLPLGRLLLAFAPVLFLNLAGCGDSGASASSIAATEGSYEAGLAAFQQGDAAAAEAQLTAAITAGSLQPDLAEAALRLRARARTAQGRTAEAEADLQELKAGAAEMDQYWLAVAELELKKGNTAAAKDAVKQARSANSKLQLPKELEQLR